MKLRLSGLTALLAPLLFTACATMGPPRPPSLDLPKPPTDLRAVRKGNRVTLTWTIPARTTDRQAARSFGSTQICRGVNIELKECGTAVGAAPAPSRSRSAQKMPESYTDVFPDQLESDSPSEFLMYAVEVRNAAGRDAGVSNQVRVPLIRTLPAPENFATAVTGRGVVLTWSRNVGRADAESPVHYLYRVQRRLDGGTQRTLVGDFPAGGESETTVTDANIEWEKTYAYWVDTVTVIAQNGSEQQIEGDDSPEIKVFAHDVFPPAVPSGLQAVFSGPGQKAFIDLVWAPVTDVDLAGYNVYRHEEGVSPVKLNAELLKTPAYRDEGVVSGRQYLYSVSAVDVRGNESARSEEATESVP